MINFDIKIYSQIFSIDGIPEIDYLLEILNHSDSLNLDAELSEYSNTYRWSWWYICPSLGYDMVNSRPMLVFNTSGLIGHFKNKRIVERKEIALEKRNILSHQGNRVKLIGLYEDLKTYIVQLQMIRENFKKYRQLYDIKELQYNNNEINSEQFLKEQIALNERKKIVFGQIDKVNAKLTDIELLLNTRLFLRVNYDKF